MTCETDGRQTPSDGKSSHCLWQGELKMSKLFYKKKYIKNILPLTLIFKLLFFWLKSAKPVTCHTSYTCHKNGTTGHISTLTIWWNNVALLWCGCVLSLWSIYSNNSHAGWLAGSSDKVLKIETLKMIWTILTLWFLRWRFF